MNMKKALETTSKTCYQCTCTFRGINSALDAAKKKQELERMGHTVTVKIGFDNMKYEGWVCLEWLE